jgi:hypothetical protein
MADNLSTTEALTNPRGPATKKVRASIGSKKIIHPRSFWQKKVIEFSKSDLPKKDFCAQHGLAWTTFWNWNHKLTRKKNVLKNPEKQKTQEFVSVLLGPSATEYSKSTIAQNYSASPSFTLNFSKNLQLSIPKDFHGPTLRRLVQILSSQDQKV